MSKSVQSVRVSLFRSDILSKLVLKQRCDTVCGSTIHSMVIRVVELSSGGYKIRKFFVEKLTYPKEIIEFWELVADFQYQILLES